MRYLILLISLLAAGCTEETPSASGTDAADYVYTNGKVYTADDDNPWAEAVAVLGTLSGWILLGRLIGQGNDLIDRNMLSHLEVGSIATFGYARAIYVLPLSIFAIGITRVIISNFSWDAAQGNTDMFKRDLSLSIRISVFFMLPITVTLIVLRQPIVQTFYQRGAFSPSDAESTELALALLSLGLSFEAMTFIFWRVFVSTQSLAFPTALALVKLVVHYAGNLILIPSLGVGGVALSLSISETIIAISYIVRTRQVLGPFGGHDIASSLLKMFSASVIMALVFITLLHVLSTVVTVRNTLVQFTLLSLLIVIGGLCYVGILYVLKSHEVHHSMKLVKNVLSEKITI